MGWTDPWAELDEYERCYWRRIGAEVLAVILLAIAAAMLLAGLTGCAAAPQAQVCYMSPLGTTEEGYAVVLQACQSPEAFRAGQK